MKTNTKIDKTHFHLFFLPAKSKTNLYCSTAICWYDEKFQETSRREGLCLTCSQEHNLILSIFCHNSVHHNLSQGVVHPDTCEHRSTGQRVDRAVHEGVESNETDHLIWEVFGGLDPCVISLAGTLMERMHSVDLLKMFRDQKTLV